jgi:hypothetical protein
VISYYPVATIAMERHLTHTLSSGIMNSLFDLAREDVLMLAFDFHFPLPYSSCIPSIS